jgi:hypothetical protein
MEIEARLDRLDEAVRDLSAAGEKHIIGDLMAAELFKALVDMCKNLDARLTAIENGILASDLKAGKN